MIFKRSKRSRFRFLNVSRNCMSLGCENWLITVNPLAASGKANVRNPNAWRLIGLPTNREVYSRAWECPNIMRLGVSKANA